MTQRVAEPCHQINVAIIGNSNSVAVSSYSRVLATYQNLNINDYSIGGITNILLLTFLANPEACLADVDVVIVELAVIEAIHLRPGAIYKPEHSSENIDLFMRTLRSCSAAQVVFLILPTMFGLLEPQTTVVEQHYTDCARRHGVALINGYSILRKLGGLDRNGPAPELLKKINRVDAAFNLNDRSQLALHWLMRQHPGELHGAKIGTKAFCEQAFEDSVHVSRMFHEMISGLLYRWICRAATPDRRIEAGLAPQNLVIRCPPLSANKFDHIERSNSFMSRRLLSLKSGDTVIYPCPSDYRAASLLLNASATSAFLNFTSPLGAASVDLRLRDQPVPWVAAVARIPGTLGPLEDLDIVGGGDICMTVSDQPLPLESRNVFRSLDTDAEPARGAAEIGELIIVRQDWRTAAAATPIGEVNPAAANIEETDWAVDFILGLAVIGARTVAGIARTHTMVRKSTLLNLLNDAFAETDEAMRDVGKARLLAAAYEFDDARAAISRGLSKNPGHALLLEMQEALGDLGP